jgi:hypothetical protein
MTKILLYCPTYTKSNGELAMRPETQASISRLVIPEGVDLDIEVDTFNPMPVDVDRKSKHENTLIKYRKARQRVLNEGYDALWTVEHDMIIPEDALVKMLDTDADVVYGLYLFRHLTPMLNALRATTGRYANMSVSAFPELVAKGKRQGWLEVSGAGNGCTLIYRRVLEKIDFHRADGGVPIPDLPFATDCIQNGFKQIARFDVPCGHIKPDGTILQPFTEGGDSVSSIKIYVYRSFNANIAGRSQHFEEGTEAEMPEDYVNDYARAGFIEIVKPKPAVKVVTKPKTTSKKAVK